MVAQGEFAILHIYIQQTTLVYFICTSHWGAFFDPWLGVLGKRHYLQGKFAIKKHRRLSVLLWFLCVDVTFFDG